MTDCLTESDVRVLAESTLAAFEQEVATLPQDVCVPFNEAGARLDAPLLTIYQFVVQFVRREEDLEKVAGWWRTMVSQCDEFAKRLRQLSLAHPDCGAALFHDRVLDLRNRCQRLHGMHA
jgi:hypothetical protein